MTAQLAYSVQFEMIDPSCCDVPFFILRSKYKARRLDHKNFWCPNCGRSQYYPQESDNEKLERRLAFEKRRRESAEREAKYQKDCARTQKAAKTRLKNRVKHGVCPCCNRTFKQLARHMKNKHPEYVSKK
jgi:RNase P subunit RPR2